MGGRALAFFGVANLSAWRRTAEPLDKAGFRSALQDARALTRAINFLDDQHGKVSCSFRRHTARQG